MYIVFRRLRLLAAALTILLLIPGCGLLPKEEEEAVPVLAPPTKSERVIYTVEQGPIVDEVILRARFVPARQEEYYARTAGRIKAVYVRSGDQVKAGQLLAELHAEEATYQAAQTKIRYERIKLNLEDARHRLQFTRSQTAENDVKRLELDLESARLDLEKGQEQIAQSRLVAAFDGQVMAVSARPGDTVAAFAPVVTVADPTELVIEADLGDDDLARLAVGQTARLLFADAPPSVTAALVELPDTTTAQSRRAVLRLNSDWYRPKLGSVGRVSVVLQEKSDVLLLPKAAVRRFADRTYVLMHNPRREVDVVLGIEGETQVEILKGLKAGDQVIGR